MVRLEVNSTFFTHHFDKFLKVNEAITIDVRFFHLNKRKFKDMCKHIYIYIKNINLRHSFITVENHCNYMREYLIELYEIQKLVTIRFISASSALTLRKLLPIWAKASFNSSWLIAPSPFLSKFENIVFIWSYCSEFNVGWWLYNDGNYQIKNGFSCDLTKKRKGDRGNKIWSFEVF